MIEDQAFKVVIPFNRPVKPVYVRAALELIDQVNEVRQAETEEENGEDK